MRQTVQKRKVEAMANRVASGAAVALFVSLCAAAMAANAFAHHGAAAYDLEHSITLTGTVTALEWTNPHCLLRFNADKERVASGDAGKEEVARGQARNEKGGTQAWTIELFNPLWLERAGWKPDSLKPGDRIRITFHAAKDGTRNGYVQDSDGKLTVNGKELPFRLPGDERIR